MNSYTHMVVGALTGGALVVNSLAQTKFGFEVNSHSIYPSLSFIPSIIGAIGPDVDMPNSKSGRIVRTALTYLIFGTFGALICLLGVILIAGNSISEMLFPVVIFVLSCSLLIFIKTSKHRGRTHTGLLWFIMMFPLIFNILCGSVTIISNIVMSVYFGFCLGWLSHLIADSFNKKGVPWLYPVTNKHYAIASVLTGSYEESVFRLITIGGFVGFYVLIIMFGR